MNKISINQIIGGFIDIFIGTKIFMGISVKLH